MPRYEIIELLRLRHPETPHPAPSSFTSVSADTIAHLTPPPSRPRSDKFRSLEYDFNHSTAHDINVVNQLHSQRKEFVHQHVYGSLNFHMQAASGQHRAVERIPLEVIDEFDEEDDNATAEKEDMRMEVQDVRKKMSQTEEQIKKLEREAFGCERVIEELRKLVVDISKGKQA